MASAWTLHCSVCKQNFETRKEWCAHLLKAQHQNLARKDCSFWKSKVKKRVLVAYANYPIATDKVFQSLTELVGRDTFVTDFVWSERRPRVGLIQFESKVKVKEILKRLGQGELKIDDEHLVQLKKAADFLDMEWDDMVADIQRDEDPTEDSLVKMETEPSENFEEEDHGGGDDDEDDAEMDVKPDINRLNACGGGDNMLREGSITPPIPSRSSMNTNLIVPKVEPVDEDEIQENSSPPTPTPPPQENGSTGGGANTKENDGVPSEIRPEEPCAYRQQFEAILSEIAIPDEEYDEALDVMEKCRQIFSIQFPPCKLYMFRHWYLKLRNNGTNELLFYVDFDGTLDGSHLQQEFYEKPFKLKQNEVEKLFKSKIAKGLLPGAEAVEKEQQVKKFEPRAYQFEHKPSGLKFSIVADSLFKTEAQTCRLVNFLLDSDPRARPFLTLIFYWAKKCKVETSKPFCKFSHKGHAFAPEPAALEWMILLFLTHKKVIPSPREVLNRSHQKLIIFGKADIGFSNAKWVNPFSSGSKAPPENSNEFFIQLAQLAREFFNFYVELRTGTWILNTRDGEVIRKDDFLNKRPYVDYKTKLKPEEIANIKAAGAEYKITMVNLNKGAILMLHPIFCRWCILFSSGTFVNVTDFKMACSAEVINQALNREGIEEQEGFSLMKMFRSNPARRVERFVNQLPFVPDVVMSKIKKRAATIGFKVEKKEDLHTKNLVMLLNTRKGIKKRKSRRKKAKVKKNSSVS